MKKYDSYKDSGIEWIGKIPSHWIMQRIDWVSKIVRGNTAFKKDELLDAGEYIALQYGKTYKVDVVDDSFNFYVNSEFFNESQVTTKGDTILISTSETVEDLGHTCFYNNQNVGLLGGEQILLKPNRKFLHEKYLYHYSRQFGSELRRYARGLKVFRFNTSDLKQLFIAIPTLEEQTAIANFLDHKTSQIDHLIAKKEQFIKLLEEERVAVINQAVTKGLDANVPMKDSGVEWLGEIPEHWEVKRIKYIANLKSGNNIVSEQITSEGIYPVYGGNGLRGYFSEYTNDGNFVLIGRQGALCGNINFATNKFWASEHAVVCYLEPNNNWLWFGKLLETMNLNQYNQSAAQPGLAVGIIKNLFIPYSNYDEQNKIIDYVNDYEIRTNNVIQKAITEIELLKEYKTALISEVVTGKVDVSTSSTQV